MTSFKEYFILISLILGATQKQLMREDRGTLRSSCMHTIAWQEFWQIIAPWMITCNVCHTMRFYERSVYVSSVETWCVTNLLHTTTNNTLVSFCLVWNYMPHQIKTWQCFIIVMLCFGWGENGEKFSNMYPMTETSNSWLAFLVIALRKMGFKRRHPKCQHDFYWTIMSQWSLATTSHCITRIIATKM